MSTHSRYLQPVKRAGSLGLFTVISLLLVAAWPAQAQTEGTWTLWVAEQGQWHQADVSAAEHSLTDKSVVAAVYNAAGSDTSQPPTESPHFNALCHQQTGKGDTQVAAIVEYGDPGIAHEGTGVEGNLLKCLSLSAPVTTAHALNQTAHVTFHADGSVSAINDYGDHTNTGSPNTGRWWLLGALLALVAGGAAGLYWYRNRNTNTPNR